MKVRHWMLFALLVPLLLASFVPVASAQTNKTNTLQISCGSGPSDIRPLGSPGTWQCTATMQFAGGISDPVNFATVALSAPNAPSWANVVISPASLSFQQSDQADGEQSKPFQVLVSLTQNAPAFQTTQIQITGQATNPNAAEQVNVLPTQIAVTPGYFNLYNVRLDQKIGQGGPQDSVTYPIVIDNFSNGDTRFEFSLLNPDNVQSGFNPVVPEPLVLNSRATGGEQTSGQVSFQVYTPFQNGYVNEIGNIQLKVDSMYAADTNIKGASSQVSTLTQARGFYVPGPATPLVILGMLGGAIAMAKLGQRED